MVNSSTSAAIAAYCLSSILMTVTNKFVLSTFLFFTSSFHPSAIQSLTCVLMLGLFRAFSLISYRPYHIEDAKKWMIVSFALVGMIYTGSKAIQHLSIPLFTIFKNLTIILIAYGERVYFSGSRVSPMMLTAFILMVTSSIIGGWSDIIYGRMIKSESTRVSYLVSYGWMTANCLLTAFYALIVRAKIKQVGFKDFDTVYYSNLLSIPILLLMSLMTELGEFQNLCRIYIGDHRLADYSELSELLIAIFVSGISGFAISYGSSWCVRVTTSTTYSMVGALNKLPIAIAGMLFFEGAYSNGSALGVFVAFCAGLLYNHAKNVQKKEEYIPIYAKQEEDVSILDDYNSKRSQKDDQ